MTVQVSRLLYCCTEPGLTKTLYILVLHTHTHNMYNMQNLNTLKFRQILLTMNLTNGRPVLSSEWAPHLDKTVIVKQ
jgi:hypothetical protein